MKHMWMMAAEQKKTPTADEISHQTQPSTQLLLIVDMASGNTLTNGEKKSTNASEHKIMFLSDRSWAVFNIATITNELPYMAMNIIVMRTVDRNMDSKYCMSWLTSPSQPYNESLCL